MVEEQPVIKAEESSSSDVTPTKKRSLKIYQTDTNYSLYEIRYEGGGEVPDALKGQFTSPHLAEKHLQKFKLAQERDSLAA